MLISEIIRKKRDGETLGADEIQAIVAGISNNSASEGQVAAFAMAVFFQGMQAQEAANLTLAMRDSGDVFDWSHLPGPVVDKHSTGGVGDNVSLMLAPIIAAAGGYVPMISGRGLGHTGGTLDKMDAIPGYNGQPDNALFDKVVTDTGCAIIGQTGNLAPADKRFYGIRDVTATVESVALITASILSKKLAAGLGALVMDVKYGNGAFMQAPENARDLANSLTRTAHAAKLPCHALITDMSQPLASAAGNAVEVLNAVNFLTGAHRDPRLEAVTLALCGEMLALSGLAKNRDAGRAKAADMLNSGHAAERFAQMVAGLGGPTDFIDQPARHLAQAKIIRAVPAPVSGYISAISTREIGLAVVELGGGRRRASDKINPAVGLTGLVETGQKISKGDPLCMIHADSHEAANHAADQITASYVIGDKGQTPNAVLEIIT